MSKRYIVLATVLAVSGGALVARAQQPQERTFPVTLTEREWLYIGSLLDEEKVKHAGAITNKIQGQLAQYLQQQAAAQQSAAEKAIRDKVAAEAKAKVDAKPAEDKKDP